MKDSFGSEAELTVGNAHYRFFSLPALAERTGARLEHLPFSLKVLLENLLRNEDGTTVSADEIAALARWRSEGPSHREVFFHPARVLMPDSSGVPLLADLAAMRDALAERGGDPRRINPRIPLDLVIDHSVAVDFTGSEDSFARNRGKEMERNRERYALVRWAEGQFAGLSVIPPGNGILHQINLEYLASVVASREQAGARMAFPDSLLGMDSHTTMINALGVFGWGVGGIEAATALLGQPVTLSVPPVVGCRVVGAKRAGLLGTDIVLTLTEFLRKENLVEAVVEFCGPGLDALGLSDRATLANMAPEYGATMGFFPIDAETIRYLAASGRPAGQVALVQSYARAQGLWRTAAEPEFDRLLTFDLDDVEPCLAGPNRPEDRVPLAAVPASFSRTFAAAIGSDAAPPMAAEERRLENGDIVIASITSCTNTSNPAQMIAAGLLARNAAARGLAAKPWIKVSLSPGSRVVSAMLERAGLLRPLADVGFHLAGYGCMSCGGNAGTLAEPITEAIAGRGLVTLGMLSSNRNFEGRLHPAVRGTYLASPPLVVAFALAGTVRHDLTRMPLGCDRAGKPVLLAELWPPDTEIAAVMGEALKKSLFDDAYGNLADGGPEWAALEFGKEPTFSWDEASLYLRRPPFLDGMPPAPPGVADITAARPLLILGDNVTTDHISPGGAIPSATEAGRYLLAHGVRPADFSTYVARRSNHEVMLRGAFANIRIRNEMVPGREGGLTRHEPSGAIMAVHEAAERYVREGTALVVIAGRNYGCGSSRDWAAKGTRLLGVRAVLAESFERIHRSNLVGMGVLPLEFAQGTDRRTLGLDGTETIDLTGLDAGLTPRMSIAATIRRRDGGSATVPLACRVETEREAEWMRHGGILPYVLRDLVRPAARGRVSGEPVSF